MRKCSKCDQEKPEAEFAKKQPTRCKLCYNAYMRDYYKRSPQVKEKMAKRAKVHRRELREEVLTHYSGGVPRCACCGETEYCFLTIDHMNRGEGPAHRKAGIISKTFYRWLRDQGYPVGFRVLCMNCNFAYGVHGHCPHQSSTATLSDCAA